MSVKLIWITPDAEKVIAYCARVSNPVNQENWDTASRLIRYCAKNAHWSVFEQACMCLEIETTRAISAQILRHRSFSFQEFSQRYAAVDAASVAPVQLRRQDLKNRQNSIDDIPDLNDKYKAQIEQLNESALKLYSQMVEDGVAKESARFVLPLATKTRLYMTGSIRSWIHYCQVRCDPSTQKEHRDVANEVKRILIENIPILSEILN
jgi:thymidylate synthase (FAD)